MAEYLLDTDTCIYWLKGRTPVRERLLAVGWSKICICSITVAELYFGAYNSSKIPKNIATADQFIYSISVLPLTNNALKNFGKLKAQLRTEVEEMKVNNLISHELRELYETDYLAWYEKTLEMVKSRRLDELDLESLREVLENLVRDTKRSGASFLEQIIRHLLMIEYWETERDYNYRHWAGEIVNFRNQLEIDMTANLRKHLQSNLEKIYQRAIKYTVVKTGFKKAIFPEQCPYTLEQLTNSDWLPEK